MADHPDFINYGAEFEDTTHYSEHAEWQHTSFLGRLTLLLLRLGNNPFTQAVIKALSEKDGEESGYTRMIAIVVNLGGLIVGILALYAFGRIFQIFIGKEIIMHQEIIIEEEVRLSDLKKAKALKSTGTEEPTQRRSARQKSTKQS